ncbi:MAG: PspC domain-containing protein [Deinococcales bacterium]
MSKPASLSHQISERVDDLLHDQRRSRRPNVKGRLARLSQGKVLAGVLGGIARYIEADPFWVRLIFVLSLVLTAAISAVGYLLLWLLLPLDSRI